MYPFPTHSVRHEVRKDNAQQEKEAPKDRESAPQQQEESKTTQQADKYDPKIIKDYRGTWF